jgi:hypothetical protein
MGRSLPFVTSNDSIKTFRHALSLDEVGHLFQPTSVLNFILQSNLLARFQPNQYQKDTEPTVTVKATGSDEPYRELMTPLMDSESDSSYSGIASVWNDQGSSERKPNGKKKKFLPFRVRSSSRKITGQAVEDEEKPDDVLEVWFAGCHCGM